MAQRFATEARQANGRLETHRHRVSGPAAMGWLAVLLLGLSLAAQAQPFNAATYNLRFNLASDGPNAWPHRRDAVRALIRHHEIDLLGTQEGLIDQIEDLECRRRSKSEPPCRPNIEPGVEAGLELTGCG